jgi:hypothetical protein
MVANSCAASRPVRLGAALAVTVTSFSDGAARAADPDQGATGASTFASAPSASERASPPRPCPPALRDDWSGLGVLGRATAGATFVEDAEPGAFGRLALDLSSAMPVHAPHVFGASLGVDGWGSVDGGGGGIPLLLYIGVRDLASLFITIGGGADLVIYDRVHDDSGVGILAPFGAAELGVELGAVRVLLDGRVQYRWQWGADDGYRISAGLGVSIPLLDLIPVTLPPKQDTAG